MLKALWRLLWPYSQDEDNGWLRKHPNAEIVEEERLPRGRKLVIRSGDEQLTYLLDDIGNVVAVMR